MIFLSFLKRCPWLQCGDHVVGGRRGDWKANYGCFRVGPQVGKKNYWPVLSA